MTTRLFIIEALSKEKMSLREICRRYAIEKKEAIAHLNHISKSLLPKRKLVRDHAVCRDCGFIFKEREKFHSPSRCPKCRSESITETRFWVE